jgi:hypothetical protein
MPRREFGYIEAAGAAFRHKTGADGVVELPPAACWCHCAGQLPELVG